MQDNTRAETRRRIALSGAGLALLLTMATGCFRDSRVGTQTATDAQGLPIAAPPATSATRSARAAESKSATETDAKPGATSDPLQDALGLPNYPGAKPLQALGGSSIPDHLTTDDSDIQTALRETPDAPEKVLDFYRARLPRAESHNVELDNQKGTVLTVSEADGSIRTVHVTSDGTKTEIELMHLPPRKGPAFRSPLTPATGSGQTGTSGGIGESSGGSFGASSPSATSPTGTMPQTPRLANPAGTPAPTADQNPTDLGVPPRRRP